MIQLGQPLNRKKTIKCPSCGDRVLYVLHDRKAGERLRKQDVRFLQWQKTTVKNPLYCSKCDSPWINKSTGRLIKFNKKIFSVNEIDSDIKDSLSKSKKDTFKYFKPMIEDCKASKIKPSELTVLKTRSDEASKMTGCKCSKDKACKAIPLKDGFYTADRGERYFLIQNGMYIPQFQPITGPGIAEMLKSDKVNRRTGYTADSIIIDECKPLTKKQIKSANDSLNRMNAKKPTNKRGAR